MERPYQIGIMHHHQGRTLMETLIIIGKVITFF